jgi:dTDP-4-amino-4,6-dideoxygalactose transaminase
MEWYEHRHDHESEDTMPHETDQMTALARLATRTARNLRISHCGLAKTPVAAEHSAVQVLFSPELGEKAAVKGDEIIVITAGESRLPEIISTLGGCATWLRISPEERVVTSAVLEESLSLSTRAVLLDHTAACIKNAPTVRNFCNKYDLWMLEIVGESRDAEYLIDGKKYCVGTLGDWSAYALCKEPPCGALLTRDAFISHLLGDALLTNDVCLTETVAEALLQRGIV